MIFEQFKRVKAFVFDVDGVLTNGQVFITDSGKQLRQFDIKDGYALKTAIKAGYLIAVITGGTCGGVVSRLNSLGIDTVFTGISDKEEVLMRWLKEHHLDPEHVLYMGDDIPDLDCLRRAGLPTCPADAAEELKQVAGYISPRHGGQGAVRDVIEKTLKLQGKWES